MPITVLRISGAWAGFWCVRDSSTPLLTGLPPRSTRSGQTLSGRFRLNDLLLFYAFS